MSASNRGSSLLAQYRPLALAIAADYWWPAATREDVRQEAMIALWKATERWDRRGAFPAFARTVIRNHLWDCLKRHRGRDGRKVLPTVMYDEKVHGLELDYEQRTADRERLRDALEVPLPRREHVVLAAVVQGYSYAEIADELGTTVSNIKQGAWKARSRLRAAA